MFLYGKMFADIMKLKIIQVGQTCHHKCLIRTRQWDIALTQRGGGGRDWNDTATSQGMPAATRSEKIGMDSCLKALDGVWSCQHLDFGSGKSNIRIKSCPINKIIYSVSHFYRFNFVNKISPLLHSFLK